LTKQPLYNAIDFKRRKVENKKLMSFVVYALCFSNLKKWLEQVWC